jgi:flagellar hook-associated protein 1 FlgK
MGEPLSLQTAFSGLQAAQAQMDTISNNIANANAPGYVRQVVNLVTADPSQTSAGWVGNGVTIQGISQVRSAFLDAAVRTTTANQANSQAQATLLQNAEQVLGEPSNGISTPLDALWSAFENAASDPSNPGAQGTVVAALTTLTNQINQVSATWSQAGQQTSQSIGTQLSTVNGQLTQLAAINEAISAASAGGSPNSLLDQRDQLLNSLAGETGATSTVNADGTATVSIGGAGVVNGTSASVLTLNGNGTITAQAGQALTLGGTIGGYQTFVSTQLPALQSQLNTFASDLASALNSQNEAGYNAAGPGGPLLSYTAGSAAATLSVVSGGSGLALAGTAGPPFPTNDGTNAQALANLQGTTVATGGTQTLDGSVASLATNLGSITAAALSSSQNAQTLLTAQTSAQSSVEGVSVDQELTNMVAAQEAYQASSRVMTTIDEMLQTVIGITANVP